MSGLYEVTTESMAQAREMGARYWKRNKCYDAPHDSLAFLARSVHCHDGDNYAWLAGFYQAKSESLSLSNDNLRDRLRNIS
jgi:hypothetical protein